MKMRKRIALLLLAVLALSLALPAGEALAAAQTGPTPPVRPANLPVVDVTSWEYTLANSYNSIGYEFELTPYVGFEGQSLKMEIIEITSNMLAAARSEGVPMYVSVAYRNWEYLLTYYENAIALYGSSSEAAKHFLPPGCNEHQTGLAIDVTSRPEHAMAYYEYDDDAEWESPANQWMLEHGAEYGFIPRYPGGKELWYGTPCNHPHYRDVGVEVAKYLTEHDLCLEEFLYLSDPHSLFVPGLTTYATF